MKNIFFLFSLLWIITNSFGQFPGQGSGGRANSVGRNMNAGHFYGKVVDEKTGKGIEFAAIQLMQNKKDSLTDSVKAVMISGQLTQSNGDFSLENIPVIGNFTLEIAALGYTVYEQKISFELKFGQGGMQKAMSAIDKDLGNIKLSISFVNLPGVTIEETTPVYEMKIDKKVYNVEKNPVNAGGTAEDVLKNVPSVNVDIDGNVSLRNAAPQIFVDGRPTTLSIDQIPADAIQSVEVITNPSAKYDASGGGGGIVNIVMKKNRRIGFNGNVRIGVDSRGRINSGADLSMREGKFNYFISGNLNQRKSKTTTETDRSYFSDYPTTEISQQSFSQTKGFFGFARGGVDYFMDNRNTFTISGMYNRGQFRPVDDITTITDSLYQAGTATTSSTRTNSSERNIKNAGGVLTYKHIYPKDGKELTADINYNGSEVDNTGNYQTQNYDSDQNPSGDLAIQQQLGSSKTSFVTAQTDFVNPVTAKIKIEAGLRGAIRNYSGTTDDYLFNYSSNDYVFVPSETSDYKYIDQVYAGYFTFTNQLNKFGYQIGIRGESSFYTGTLTDVNLEFNHSYPITIFPSIYLSYKLNEKNELQLNYTKRINRPTFFQLLPYTDYSDSLNLTKGNPDLKPELTNSAELSYLKTFSKKNTLHTSAYFKYTTDLITRYQYSDYDSILSKSAITTTYANANSGYSYGAEITSQNTITKWFDLSINLNAYESYIDASNLESDLTNKQFSWFTKVNSTFRLPKNFSLQITADYTSQTSLPVNSGGSGGRGGGGMGMGGPGMFGGNSSTAQGYTEPNYGVDAALKFEFAKNKAASITLGVNDIFKTRKNETYSSSSFFTQTTLRIRDQQIVRLNFSYRFGKFDVSLFKRKNTRIENESITE
ncbi:MAG: outer membrane beta-barrel protein [Bacteroidia bacterium]